MVYGSHFSVANFTTRVLALWSTYKIIGIACSTFTMTASEAAFLQFGDSLTKLRLAIWRQCIPKRILFGLGDTPVQLIDASNKTRIGEFLRPGTRFRI